MVLSGHRPSVRQLRNDLHLLLRLLLAGEALAHFAASDLHRASAVFDHSEWEFETISTLLVSSAAILRVIDDGSDRKLARFSTYVGNLQTQVVDDEPLVQGLTLREACNKTIHASEVEFDRVTHASGLTFLRPIADMRGTHKKTTWVATIDIIAFVREALFALDESFKS
jgi:hypothetical protein